MKYGSHKDLVRQSPIVDTMFCEYGTNNWKKALETPKGVYSLGVDHLQLLIQDEFERHADIACPHNLIKGGLLGNYPCRPRVYCSHEEKDETLAQVARLKGWLCHLNEYPLVKKLFSKGLSVRGMNSPYTYINPWSLTEKFRSPGRLHSWLRKVRKRSDLIIASYCPGFKTSWEGLAVAAQQSSLQVGKAAVVAAAATCHRLAGRPLRIQLFYADPPQSFKKAREALIRLRGLNKYLALSEPLKLAVQREIRDQELHSLGEAVQYVLKNYVYTEYDGTPMYINRRSKRISENSPYTVYSYSGVLVGTPKSDTGTLVMERRSGRTFHSYHEGHDNVKSRAERAWQEQDRVSQAVA